MDEHFNACFPNIVDKLIDQNADFEQFFAKAQSVLVTNIRIKGVRLGQHDWKQRFQILVVARDWFKDDSESEFLLDKQNSPSVSGAPLVPQASSVASNPLTGGNMEMSADNAMLPVSTNSIVTPLPSAQVQAIPHNPSQGSLLSFLEEKIRAVVRAEFENTLPVLIEKALTKALLGSVEQRI